MRFDTLNASNHLVWRLQYADNVQQLQDDGDLISVWLTTGEAVLIYIVERPISTAEILYHYETNTARGQYSLFFFQVALMLPEHGDTYLPDDWMAALLSIQHDKIYAYEGAGKYSFLFPVYFQQGQGAHRTIRYGNIINFAGLHCETVVSEHPHFKGTWRVASFEDSARQARSKTGGSSDRTPLQFYYEILGLNADAPLAAVKQAFRALARQYHPDLNHSREAHLKMKQLNDAYQRILSHAQHSKDNDES